MSHLIASFAAFTLLVHGLVGCCWHHQHVEAAAGGDEAQILPVVCGGHFHAPACHQHADEHEPGAPADHRHSGDDGCGETNCQFVKADSTTAPSLVDGLTVALVPAVPPAAHADWRLRARDNRGRHLLEGVPLHLRHQVLVI